MLFSPQEAFQVLEHYKYLVIFPVAVLEGPIITVIGGFLVYLKYVDFTPAYLLLVLGDWVGDALHYFFGRYYSQANWFRKVGKYFGYDEVKEKIIEEHFKTHPGKTVLSAKVFHGVGGLIQIVAGMARMNFFDFMKYSLIGTLPKAMLLMALGYYLGTSYEKIGMYMDRVAYFVVIFLALLLFYVFLRKRGNSRL